MVSIYVIMCVIKLKIEYETTTMTFMSIIKNTKNYKLLILINH